MESTGEGAESVTDRLGLVVTSTPSRRSCIVRGEPGKLMDERDWLVEHFEEHRPEGCKNPRPL